MRLAPALLQRPSRRAEPHYVIVIKALLYALGLLLYVEPLSSPAGVVAAVVAGWAGMALAYAAYRRRLRVSAALILTPLMLLVAVLLGERLLQSEALSSFLGIQGTFITSDVVTFGLGALCVVFLLRLLSNYARLCSLLEVTFVTGSVAMFLAAHRNRMLNRPRFLSDWSWALGIDPSTVLVAVGAAAALLAALLFLREQPLLKLLTTIVLLALLGIVFYSVSDKRIATDRPADALGLSGKKNDNRRSNAKGKGSGGSEDNPFKDNYDSSGQPTPVAIAILRDDLKTDEDILYFRQRALSKYNGVRLTADDKWDKDVLTEFPSGAAPLKAAPAQVEEAHTRLPTTMYLLVDHPQPPALTHAISIRMVKNPSPQQFVAAYEVESLVLAVPPRRLLGRRSIPDSWSAEKKRHYLAVPDDPRYRALADIITRSIDPRFADDDLAKAFAIKRYLEQEGFYTRRTTHASQRDPTASFLFGDKRGYCVHFAHAAVYMFRTQGIAARVALGYAVQTLKRGGGSSVLIMSDRAHAWPEIYLEGVGWLTFDIYPEHTDLPPAPPVDYDLEKMLGELARHDPTAGVTPDGRQLVIPWRLLGLLVLLALCLLVIAAFLVKLVRALAPRWATQETSARLAYREVLDRLAEVGHGRLGSETREGHAQRLASVAPHLEQLTQAHLALAFGGQDIDPQQFAGLLAQVRAEIKQNVHPLRRLVGICNPLSWLWTR